MVGRAAWLAGAGALLSDWQALKPTIAAVTLAKLRAWRRGRRVMGRNLAEKEKKTGTQVPV
jgi:hypothetical protein